MKTLIVGMGNIGVIHGWALSQSGADITHVVRKGSLAKYADGVKIDILDMRGDSPRNDFVSYLPRMVDDPVPEDGYELVLVATHHLQAASAVRQYRELGGYGGDRRIVAALPLPLGLLGIQRRAGQ
jgi:ketopantoate reductase